MNINRIHLGIAVLVAFVSASGFTLGRPDEAAPDKYKASKFSQMQLAVQTESGWRGSARSF